MDTLRILVFPTAFLFACTVKEVDLGEQELEASSSSDGHTTHDEPIGTEGGGNDDPSDPSAGGSVGAMCGHGDAVIESAIVTFPALACGDLLCVYADNAEAPAGHCDDDAACNTVSPFLPRFVCDLPTHSCVLDPDYVAERSFCSLMCEDDTDCLGEAPSACQTGFSCAVVATLGSAVGCQGLCVCNDDLDEQSAAAAEADCIQGSAGACQQNPGQGLCPD